VSALEMQRRGATPIAAAARRLSVVACGIFSILALAGALLASTPASAQASATATADKQVLELDDGPYVDLRDDEGWKSRSVGPDGTATTGSVSDGRIHVPAVGDVPAFSVTLRAPPRPAPSIERLGNKTPLFVLADTHGEFSILVAFLKAQGIIDDQLAWSFGKGHLAVTGDMLDRGAHQLEILWLFYKLEQEARNAGGRVHIVLGNHEALVLRGDERYLNPRYPEIAKRLGVSAYSELLGPDTVLGAWLRTRPSVLKLGDNLILHGGISRALAASTLSQDAINATVRRYLDFPHTTRPDAGSDDALVMGNDGPLWYRGYFPSSDQPPAASDADVAAALARFGVARILVGHTIVERVQPLYDGKVIAVQVYPHMDEASGLPILEGVLRLEGVWHRATAQGGRFSLAGRR
jgi:hypothetical protein